MSHEAQVSSMAQAPSMSSGDSILDHRLFFLAIFPQHPRVLHCLACQGRNTSIRHLLVWWTAREEPARKVTELAAQYPLRPRHWDVFSFERREGSQIAY